MIYDFKVLNYFKAEYLIIFHIEITDFKLISNEYVVIKNESQNVAEPICPTKTTGRSRRSQGFFIGSLKMIYANQKNANSRRRNNICDIPRKVLIIRS